MQIYDVLMLIVLAGALLFGVWKGMAWQVASLASVVLSGAVAIHSSPAIAPWFGSQEPWNRFCAMAVLYVITAGAIWMLFRLVSNIIDRVRLKEFDRQLGATFGLAKGVLYCVVITFFAVTLSESSRQVVLASRSGDLIARGIRNANPVLPEDVRKYLGEYIDQLDKGLHAPPQNPAPQNAASQTDGTNPKPQATTPPNEAQKESPKPAAPASPAEGRGPGAKLKKMLLGK
jgi:membrane protein required for colicin V production